MIIMDRDRKFGVDQRARGAEVHLLVRGDLDMATSTLLEGLISSAEGVENADVVMDLERVTFMDSSGVLCFLRAAERADLRGSGFSVVRVPAAVRRVMEVCGKGHLLDRTVPDTEYSDRDACAAAS